MRQTRFLSHINKIGIFASSLLLTVTAVYLYSPILGSHAGDGVTTRFEAVINPVASITLDTSDLVFDIAPTASGTFSSSPITATVSTNSLGGYELYFSSDDDETDMIHDDAEISDVIASDFSGTVTSETMGANKWGYSLDNVDFLKIPTATNQLELRNIDHYPEAAEKTNTIYIGTKISTALTSGLYSKDVKFTAVAHDNPPAIPSMANFDKTTLVNVGDSVEVEDPRDGDIYVVKKLADGKVWMVENLRLGGDEPITLTPENSDVESDFVLPASSMSGFSGTDYNNNSVYVDETYGGYYSYYTATAGEGGTNKTSGTVSHSICPKGWRMPTPSDYQVLYSNYNSVSSLFDVPGFKYNGYMINSTLNYQGTYGSAWSASVASSQGAYLFSFNNTGSVNTGTQQAAKATGGAVRCIVEDRTINDITYMQDMTSKVAENTPIDTVATLTDIRDNNTYTVRKLKDGKVWMTQNLKLINKTISSTDSNLPSGETYTVPASNLSSFTTSYDTNSAYLDSTYGGYYNFYTATAGWGTNSVTSGKSPKDICPKGWRLPTGGSYGELNTLYRQYNSADLMMGVPNFTLPGNVNNGSVYAQGSSGFFRSSTVHGANNAYSLSLKSSGVNQAYDGSKLSGFSVRCMAR